MATDSNTAAPARAEQELRDDLRRELKRELDRLMEPWIQGDSAGPVDSRSPDAAPKRESAPRN